MRRAKETIHLPGERTIEKGALIEDDDEALKGRDDLFEASDGGEPKQARARRTTAKKTDGE